MQMTILYTTYLAHPLYHGRPLENHKDIFLLYGWHFSHFFPCGGLFATFFSACGALFTMSEPFCSLFFIWRAFFALVGGLLWAGAHAYYIYYNTAMLKCIKIQIYIITVIIPTQYICIYCYEYVLRMSAPYCTN